MLIIDSDRRLIRTGRKTFTLPPREFTVLEVLAKAGGKIVSREHFAEVGINGYRLVDQHVARLRRKLGKDVVRTSQCYGYAVDRAAFGEVR